MALIVEDGSGVQDAESLCSVAAADAYHASRGNVLSWEALDTTERKEQCLRRAYDYLLGVYGPSWPSRYMFGTHEGAVPRALAQASALVALRAKDGPLMPEPTAQKIKTKVGPIETEYALLPTAAGPRRFPDVDRLVGPYLAPRRMYSVPLERS